MKVQHYVLNLNTSNVNVNLCRELDGKIFPIRFKYI